MDQSNLPPITKRCTFVGLPSSGKTSFIGALWHVVESAEINSTYKVDVLPGDREYLNRLQKNFLACEAPERTKTDFVKKIEIEVTERSTGKVATFIFPDLSGETFKNQFEYRKIGTDYIAQVSGCDSLMLFISPINLKKNFPISILNGMFNDGDDEVDQAMKTIDLATHWIPQMCQTQVVIVDLIQIIRKVVKTPYKIGVIVSAWDIIKQSLDKNQAAMTPDQWLKHELPLLSQYLQANHSVFPSKVFGISAQGGEYKGNDNSELLSKERQSERLIVQSGDTINHDITQPLKWLFDE